MKEVRDFKHFSDSQFRSDLSLVHWDTILRYDDPNTRWIAVWKSIFHEILNKHAPLPSSLDYAHYQAVNEGKGLS